MVRKRQDITNAEQAVIEALWELGKGTIRQVTDIVYPNGTASNFSSVQKLLERLETKRFVRRKKAGNVYEFQPLVDREQLIGQRLSAVADSLCDGSLTPLLEHLVQAHELTKAQRASLDELIDQLDQTKKSNEKS